MSEKAPGPPPEPLRPSDELEPLDLGELRAARALAEALERRSAAREHGEEPALQAAALVASARAPALSEEARARIAEEIFGRRAPARRRWGWGLGVAAALAVAVFGTANLFLVRAPARTSAAMLRQGDDSAQARALMREEARGLVASLLAQGATPAERARDIAEAARARLSADGEAGP